MHAVIIDVRERDEFDSEQVKGSINIPLSIFGALAPGIITNLNKRKIILMCLSGNRSGLAIKQIYQLGLDEDNKFEVYSGGIKKWKFVGNETISYKSNHLPIIRQVHLAAGLLVTVSVALGFFVNPLFYALAGFVGAGLMFAGATGTCLMGELLSKMPWNQSVPNLKQEVCSASTGKINCINTDS